MAAPERRVTPRFNLHTRLCFQRKQTDSEDDQQASAINISTRGVFFATTLVMSVGEAIEVLLEIPKRVTGVKAVIRRFTGRVAHIESISAPGGTSGIGVQFLYYDRHWAKLKS